MSQSAACRAPGKFEFLRIMRQFLYFVKSICCDPSLDLCICCDPSLELSCPQSSKDGSQHVFMEKKLENYPKTIL